MQNHLFRWEFAKEQHVQKITLRATEAGLFPNVVYVYGRQIFRRNRRSKTVFFEVRMGRKISRENVQFDFAKEFST